jgi:hypothetical protein
VIPGETDNARRELPMSARVRSIFLRRWKSAQKQSEGWMFPADTKSGQMEPSTLKKVHIKALAASKVRRFVIGPIGFLVGSAGLEPATSCL